MVDRKSQIANRKSSRPPDPPKLLAYDQFTYFPIARVSSQRTLFGVSMKLPQGIAAAAAAATRAGRASDFRVVMVYDDFVAGKRAMETCNFLLMQLGRGVQLNSSMWKFDVLRCAKLKEMAVEDALEADVVIVANGRNCGLPPEVIDWLKCWTPTRRSGAAALVALMDYTGEDSREPARAHITLKHAAAKAGMDFLSQEIRSGDSAEPMFPALESPGKLPSHENPLPDRPASEGWGLND